MNNASTPVREWSNPTAAGLVALAVACACFFAMLTGRVSHDALPLVGAWLLGGFIVQLVVAFVDLKGGSHAGGNTFLFFSAFFMLTGGIEMFLKYNALKAGQPLDARLDGYAWAILTLVLLLWTPAFLVKFSLLSVIVLLLDFALPFITLVDLGLLPKGYLQISAWCLLAAGLTGVYLSGAMVVNTAYGRMLYPLPGTAAAKPAPVAATER